jgi:hypothetical protein
MNPEAALQPLPHKGTANSVILQYRLSSYVRKGED